MAIRLRTVELNGARVRVALCAVEADAKPGDVYLDDGDHYALAAKFRRDWQGQTNDFPYPAEWEAMDSQKQRDAREELQRRITQRCSHLIRWSGHVGWCNRSGGYGPEGTLCFQHAYMKENDGRWPPSK